MRRSCDEHWIAMLVKSVSSSDAHAAGYPPTAMMASIVCATIANCDDYEVVDWRNASLAFLRGFSECYQSIANRLVALGDEPA
jgi:hypothetical protein